ncbi:MAG: hypothetical protein ACKOSS_04920 [Planctomycetia bacterium]
MRALLHTVPALSGPPGARCLRPPRALWVLLATLGLLVGALGGRAPAAHAEEGWWGDLDKGLGVRLGDVLQSPERYRGRVLTFTCVFHQVEREFNPLRTRFHVERYDNVSVWPDGASIWEREAFAQDFPFLYIARAHAQRDALVQQPMYTRLEVTARIEAVVDGYPFLEVTAVRATGYKLGRQVMDLMLAGEVHGAQASADSQAVAAQKFEAALQLLPDLAPVYAARIRERLATALRRLGRDADAERVLAAAVVPPGEAGPAAVQAGGAPAAVAPAAVAAPAAAPARAAPAAPAPPVPTRLSVPPEGSPDGEPAGLPGGASVPPAAPAATVPAAEPAATVPAAAPAAPVPAAPALPSPPRVQDRPLPVPGEGPPPRRPRLQGVR